MANMRDRIIAGLAGTVTTLVVQRALASGWRFFTGEEPPTTGDPETSTVEALVWVIASGVGLSVSQLLVSRYAAQKLGSLSS